MDLRPPTWLTLYSLSLNFLVDNACARHRPQHWLYHWHVCPRSETVRSLSLQQKHGTICHQKWHLQSPCKHLRLNLILICSGPHLHYWLKSDCCAIGIFHDIYCIVSYWISRHKQYCCISRKQNFAFVVLWEFFVLSRMYINRWAVFELPGGRGWGLESS